MEDNMNSNTKMKHTPGPWTPGDIIRAPRETLPGSGGRGICRLYSESRKQLRSEQEANAYLIAAAPEMLEALEGMLEAIGILRQGGVNVLAVPQVVIAREMAHKVIAKARGE
jgi:hypothetical protein